MPSSKYSPVVALLAISGSLVAAPAVAKEAPRSLDLDPTVKTTVSAAYLKDLLANGPFGIRVCNEQHNNNFFHSHNIKHGCMHDKSMAGEGTFDL